VGRGFRLNPGGFWCLIRRFRWSGLFGESPAVKRTFGKKRTSTLSCTRIRMFRGCEKACHNTYVTADTDSRYAVPQNPRHRYEGMRVNRSLLEGVLDVWAACSQVADLGTLQQSRFQQDATSAPVLRNAFWNFRLAGLRETAWRERAPSVRITGLFISVPALFNISRFVRQEAEKQHR
jgi:hypothetical protein